MASKADRLLPASTSAFISTYTNLDLLSYSPYVLSVLSVEFHTIIFITNLARNKVWRSWVKSTIVKPFYYLNLVVRIGKRSKSTQRMYHNQ